MSQVPIDNFRGGLNLTEPTLIEDNQFEVLLNMFYNADKRLQTRQGIVEFGDLIDTKPITSLFHFKNDTTGDVWLLATSGTNLYQFNSGTDAFVSVKSGLTEFEADGVTRTRWSFAVYLNKVYLCNGVDDYAEYDPATTTYTVLATQPKVRQLAFLADAIYGGGEDLFPNTLYFTNAGAVDGRTLDANSVVVGADEAGRINGLEELQQQVLTFKDKKVFAIAGDGSRALPIDAENGGYGDRAIKRVNNSLLYFNDRGIETLRAKNGITSTLALESEPLSDDVRELFAQVVPKSFNVTTGEYIQALTNYYVTFDTSATGIPDTTLVYSTLTRAWSQYTYPSLFDYVRYVDEDNVEHYLISSGTTGQVYEIEIGFEDIGQPIPCTALTKKWDFDSPTLLKTSKFIDIVGLKSIGGEITATVLVDDANVSGTTITDEFVTSTVSSLTLGTGPLGTSSIGGGGGGNGNGLDLFPFFVRIPMYATGNTIQVRLESNETNFAWTLEKITIDTEPESIDLFSFDNIG